MSGPSPSPSPSPSSSPQAQAPPSPQAQAPPSAETIATIRRDDGTTLTVGARYGPGDRLARWRTALGSTVACTVAEHGDRRLAVLALARALGARWRIVAADESPDVDQEGQT